MKNINSKLGLLCACLLAAGTCSVMARAAGKAKQTGLATPVKIAVISDPHLYNVRLGTGPAFEEYLRSGDPKLLKESEAILEAALAKIVDEGAQILLITGDMTKDGELVNHVLMAQHLQKLEQKGVQVFVVPGNHDINNGEAVRYVGDTTRRVPNTSPQTFRAIYNRFGFGEAIARDATTLSYVAEPVEGLWLLAIDSCRYLENPPLGEPVIGGRISGETMAWITSTLQEARARNKQVIAFMHHGLNMHFVPQPLLFPDYLVENWPAASMQLAAAGLKVIFTGHYHSQDAAFLFDAEGHLLQPICDVQTASLAQFPCAFRIVTIEGDSLDIRSERITEIQADTGGVPFQQYAYAQLRANMQEQVIQTIMDRFGVPRENAAAIEPIVTVSLIANYAGDETPTAEIEAMIQGLIASPEPLHTLGLLLLGLWTDLPPGDNSLVVPFVF